MVAVIGRPAQSKLGEVACTYYKAALLVCYIHQDLGALPGLRILISNIMDIDIVINILEVLDNCVRYGYFS